MWSFILNACPPAYMAVDKRGTDLDKSELSPLLDLATDPGWVCGYCVCGVVIAATLSFSQLLQ